jgi:hypothetical protein
MQEWRYSSIILDLEVTGQLQAPATSPPGISLRCPLDRKLGRPLGRYGHYWDNCIVPAGNRITDVQPVAIPTKLSRLLISVESERKTMEYLSHDSWCHGHDPRELPLCQPAPSSKWSKISLGLCQNWRFHGSEHENYYIVRRDSVVVL